MKVELDTSSNKRKGGLVDLNTSKKIKFIHDKPEITDPKYKKPLDYPEWKREIVYRSNPKYGKVADVFYHLNFILKDKVIKYKLGTFTHIAVKLPEFEEYLASKGKPSSGLTVDNFTFKHEPMGLNDSSKEIVRTACQRAKQNPAIKKQVKKYLPAENSLIEVKKEPLDFVSETTKDVSKIVPNPVSSLKRAVGDTKFLEPFKYSEWRREVFYNKKRKVNHVNYYYNNIKLRSKEQIEKKIEEFDQYLQSKGQPVSGLTVDNFTFKHFSTGINDDAKESTCKRKTKSVKGKVTINKVFNIKKEMLENTSTIMPSSTLNHSSSSFASIKTESSINYPPVNESNKESTKKSSPALPKTKRHDSGVSGNTADDKLEISEIINESSIENRAISSYSEKMKSLVQEMIDLQQKSVIDLENNFKNKDIEYKKLLIEKNRIENLLKEKDTEKETLVDKINEKEIIIQSLFDKIKKLEGELEYKIFENKEIRISYENEISNLNNVTESEMNRLKKELNEAKSEKDNILQHLDRIKQKFETL